MNGSHEENWIARLKSEKHRDQAIAELNRILVRGLTRSLALRYGGKIQAEDIAQEAMLKILDSLDRFEGRSRFTTWAMTIATRIGVSELRRRRFQDVSLDSMTAGENLRIEVTWDGSRPAEAELDRRQLMESLKLLIETELSDKQRQATQGVLDGLPVEEVARRMGSNRNAVYKLIHDARMKLREGFARLGIGPNDISDFGT